MKKPTGLLEQTGEGLEDLNEWIFAKLEKKKNEENKEYPEIKEKLLALEGIAQDILSESSWNLTEQKNDPHFLFVKYLKNQILFHYLFTEKKSATEFIITSRVMAIAQPMARARAKAETLAMDLAKDLALAKADAETLAMDLAMARTESESEALAEDLAKALALTLALALVQAQDLAMDLAKDGWI